MDGMRTGTYTEGLATAKVTISAAVPDHLRVLEVSSLVCDAAARGKGHATALMRRLMAIADDHGQALLVVVEPFSDSPMDDADLADWYARLGFTEIQHEPCIMARAPNRTLNG